MVVWCAQKPVWVGARRSSSFDVLVSRLLIMAINNFANGGVIAAVIC